MSIILALDPGNTRTGYVCYDGHRVVQSDVVANDTALHLIERGDFDVLAVEMIASYGMAVGREVFETCVWIGRFVQRFRAPDDTVLVFRRDVKLHLCGSPRAKDANIRQALLDIFPPTGGGKTPQIGTKAKPGPLFGVSSHAWAALGVAVTCAHHRAEARAA